jgi:hypothetical protein
MNQLFLLKGRPNELIGDQLCGRHLCGPTYLSTSTGTFHKYLASLSKTPMTSTEELDLLTPFLPKRWRKVASPNPIFFLELSQLGDTNQTRAAQFRRDLQKFLDLDQELPPVPNVRPIDRRSNVKKNVSNFEICSDNHIPLRTELMKISRNASIWFRDFFLQSEDVIVSSQSYLEELFESWMVDPCDSKLDG